MSGLDGREDVVFSVLVTHHWVCVQRERLTSGLPGDFLRSITRNCSDIVQATVQVIRLGSKVGRCSTYRNSLRPATCWLDAHHYRLEKECISFRSWVVSLIQERCFPLSLAGKHCSLPVYCLCCLGGELDQGSFAFSGRTNYSWNSGKVPPWVNDWCKAWTVTTAFLPRLGSPEHLQLAWWCLVDLLVGNPSSRDKDQACWENEWPFPSLSATRFASPLDRLARRLALCQFLLKSIGTRGRDGIDVTDIERFMMSHGDRSQIATMLRDSWMCVAVARPKGQDSCFLFHGLCDRKKLSSCETEECMAHLEGSFFYRDCILGPVTHSSVEMDLLALFWCDFRHVSFMVTSPSTVSLLPKTCNAYIVRVEEDSPANVYRRELDALVGNVSAAVAVESCRLLRPRLSDAFLQGPHPRDSPAWVEWQTGWIHEATSGRVAVNGRLTYDVPAGFWLPLASNTEMEEQSSA